MKHSVSILVIAFFFLLGSAHAQTQVPNTFQSGTPARAADVNANFDELESAIDQNANDIQAVQQQAAVNADSVSDVNAELAQIDAYLTFDQEVSGRLERDINYALRSTPCGDYKVFGCVNATSANGTTFSLSFDSGRDFMVMADENNPNVGDTIFVAIPVSPGDYQNLWIGGPSNITRTQSGILSNVLVDDCDNPTVLLVPTDEPASRRLVTNNGNFFRARIDPNTGQYEPIIETVDVTGQTFGYINSQKPGNIVEACSTVSNLTGLYDSYAIDLKFNTLDGRFDSLWTYQ